MAESGLLGTPGDGRGGLMVVRTLIAAAAGGTASVLSGGKFANGAITGAMGHLFNSEGGGRALARSMGMVAGGIAGGAVAAGTGAVCMAGTAGACTPVAASAVGIGIAAGGAPAL